MYVILKVLLDFALEVRLSILWMSILCTNIYRRNGVLNDFERK